MKICIFGLAITSSWGNGHATTYRALCDALFARGHSIVFFEHNTEWYQNNRDLPHPPYCRVTIFEDWKEVRTLARAELRDSDVAVVGSFFPDGATVLDEIFDAGVPIKAFYDIDTPITLATLKRQGETYYLLERHLPQLDLYFSFTGGPLLQELESTMRVKTALPLYCSFDPQKYRELPRNPEFACEMSYMGTYAPDRQPKVEELLCEPARRLPRGRFIVAGPQYPSSIVWPGNVERIIHLNPRDHASLYSSSRLTLNVTRREMMIAGFSPSVRLFEAAACGATIVSDNWHGLDTFFAPGKEILIPAGATDAASYLTGYDDSELRNIGRAARERVLAGHTSACRALEFEKAVAIAAQRTSSPMAIGSLR
ncbi:MAG TPA: glycosyltransferase [Candidatus Angelobacter sp.]|nr:glycosyltransferase [Candidatus Angelobacter sp.]